MDENVDRNREENGSANVATSRGAFKNTPLANMFVSIANIFRRRNQARLNPLVVDCGYHCLKAKPNQQGLFDMNAKTWPGSTVCYATATEGGFRNSVGIKNRSAQFANVGLRVFLAKKR